MAPEAIKELRDLLATVGWTRLVTDYIPEDCEVEEGWRIHDMPDDHPVAYFVCGGIENEAEAKLFVALANAAPELLDHIAKFPAS